MERVRGEKRDDYVWHKNNAKGLITILKKEKLRDIMRVV